MNTDAQVTDSLNATPLSVNKVRTPTIGIPMASERLGGSWLPRLWNAKANPTVAIVDG